MSWYHPSSLLDKIFEGGILIKGAHGALEFVGGLLLLFIDPATIQRFIAFITQGEIAEDKHARFANFLLHSSQQLTSGSRGFLIAYLWVHAVIKLIAVFGILRDQLWAYPFSLGALGLFMVYQVYLITVKASLVIVLLTLFDVFILWLIWREYGKAKLLLAKKKPQAGGSNG